MQEFIHLLRLQNFPKKTNIFYPLIRTLTENFVHILNEWYQMERKGLNKSKNSEKTLEIESLKSAKCKKRESLKTRS